MPNSCPSAHDSQLLLVQLVQAHAVDNQESHVPSLICCRADFKSLMKGHAPFLWVIEQEGIFTVCVCLFFFFFFVDQCLSQQHSALMPFVIILI